MIIQNRRGRHGRSSSILPTQIQVRLACIARQTQYSQQVDTLSMSYPHCDVGAYRWCLPFAELPFLHAISTSDHGNQMQLHALVQTPSPRVVSLQKIYSDWYVSSVLPEADVVEVLPDRLAEFNAAWLRKPASKSQMLTVAKQLAVLPRALPRLTAFNANTVIQVSLIKRHLSVVCSMIATAKNSQKINLHRTH